MRGKAPNREHQLWAFCGRKTKNQNKTIAFTMAESVCIFEFVTSVAITLILEYLIEMYDYNRKRKKEGCFLTKLNCFSCEIGKAWKLKICVYAASRHLKTDFFT